MTIWVIVAQCFAQTGIFRRQGRQAALHANFKRPLQYTFELVYGRAIRRHAAHKCQGVLKQTDHRGGGQCFFGRKVLVEAGFGYPDFRGHFVHRHQVKTFFREQAIRCIDDGVLADDQLLLFERELGFFTHRLRFRPVSFELSGLYGTRTIGGALAVLLMVFFARKLPDSPPNFYVYIGNNTFLRGIMIDKIRSANDEHDRNGITARLLASTIGYDRAPPTVVPNS